MTAPGPGLRARQELRLAVLLCVVGAAVVLLTTSRDWLRVSLPQAHPLPTTVEHLAGGALVPGARPLALVGLAGVAALFAARRSGRILVGMLVLLAGAGVVILTGRLIADSAGSVARLELARSVRLPGVGRPHLGPWPWLCLAGGLLIATAGLLVSVRGRRWATLSSAYDAPSGTPSARRLPEGSEPEPAEVGEKAVWDALDRGEDPTG